MPLIALKALHPDKRNANICAPETLEKIRRNIERTGLCPPLIVRPHSKRKGQFILIDGHHRKQVLEQLGWKEVECQVWDIPDSEAQIALATLNRLKGSDDIKKRAELLSSLIQTFSLAELETLIPESQAEIEDMLSFLQWDSERMEREFKHQVEKEAAELPVPFGFMVPADQVPVVQEALNRFQAQTNKSDQTAAFIALCQFVVRSHDTQIA